MSFDGATLRALARVLDYPGPQTLEMLPLADALLTGRCTCPAEVRPCGSMTALLETLRCGDLIDLQERWLDTFDRGRRTSLHLFEHVHGDSRDRGQAMVDLLAMYRGAGLQPASEQLPDYLPVFLEYASLLPEVEAASQLADVAHILRAIGDTLLARRSPYAAVFEVLLGLVGEGPLGAGAETDSAAAAAADDTTPEAIDAAWKDAPVNFLDAAAPRSPAPAGEQPIRLHRRVA
jgi:nitrate reductase delta subunit